MTAKLNNANYIVKAEFGEDDQVDILEVTDLEGRKLELDESGMNAVCDDLLRGKFEEIAG